MPRRKTDAEVRDTLLFYGYTKIGPYSLTTKPIKCLDSDGYIVYPSLSSLEHNKIPARFHKANPDAIENIKHYIKNNNVDVRLCSEVFIDSHANLLFQCKCGNFYEASWSNFAFKDKHCCNNCAKYTGEKVPFDTIRTHLANRSLTLLFTEEEYTGIKTTKLPIVNNYGYKALFSEALYYRENSEPEWFHPSNPYTIENINLYLSKTTNNAYLCVSDVYVGNKEPLVIMHKECGRTFDAKWINLYRKPSKNEPNRHGTQCPYCTGLRLQSLHAVVLKQIFQRLKPDTVIEDQSCRNPLTNCILPTDIVNHNDKVAIEIQSGRHDIEYQKIKDKIKKEYWENRGYTVYTPDIRNYSVLEMVQLFFPSIFEIPEWVDYKFGNKLDIDMAQNLLNNGFIVSEVANKMNVPPHRIYDAIYNHKLFYPYNYPNKTLIQQNDYINQQETVQTAGCV
jgi:hypothetical protein